MLSCKEAADRLSESLDQKLSFKDHIELKIHLMLCKLCSRYNKQLQFIHRTTKECVTKYEEGANESTRLSEEGSDRISKQIKENNN